MGGHPCPAGREVYVQDEGITHARRAQASSLCQSMSMLLGHDSPLRKSS